MTNAERRQVCAVFEIMQELLEAAAGPLVSIADSALEQGDGFLAILDTLLGEGVTDADRAKRPDVAAARQHVATMIEQVATLEKSITRAKTDLTRARAALGL